MNHQENHHNISTWKTRKSIIDCHIPTSSSTSIQQNDDKLKCKYDDDDNAKEEEYNENVVELETKVVEEITGRERLKRHREEMKGKVKVPENWEKEKKLKEWVDYTKFDALIFAPHALIVTARDALIADVRKSRSQRLRIHT
ncbi:protein BIC2 [Trifolium pratense]|uniref:protein BIC2 n=1 Tax=Trifolium pratense TaxID=57577 RepID=UPI001E693552|nr:protein BIC2 [Trifolium pratense]